MPRLPAGAGAPSSVPVAVVIPARNEEASLPNLLAALALAAPRPEWVVVVDDASTDATAQIAGDLCHTVSPRPEGWNGKPWACHAGVVALRDAGVNPSVWCFVDADVVPAPDLFGRVAEALGAQGGGLVSVQPHHVPGSSAEALSAIPNVIALMAVGAADPLARRRPPTGAFGPVLAMAADAYDRVGGHAAVRGALMEDLALCSLARRAALPVRVFGGLGAATFRMYPEGLRQTYDGWTRSLGIGAAKVRPLTLILVAAWISGLVGATLGLATPTPTAALVYAMTGVQVHVLARRVGRFPWWIGPGFPLSAALFLLAFARSLRRVLTRRTVRWKDRDIKP